METQEAMSEYRTGTETRIENRELELGLSLDRNIEGVLVIFEFECGTKFRIRGSWCEAVIVVLQGLMSSEVELVQGCDRGCDRFRTSQDLSAKSCKCYGT